MYVIHCCEYDDQKREILASSCFLGLCIHYRVCGGRVNRSDHEVARYNEMHFRCNFVIFDNLYATEVPDVTSLYSHIYTCSYIRSRVMLLLHTDNNKMLVMTGKFLFKKCVQ